ncbi:glycoside hydrolase family 75 protein [Haloferula sp.]|uniref:glycoside hydrolase family 75 protein n=1 Tax=Haloferula sp. TaxID=2497595 RepID=UPI003C706993
MSELDPNQIEGVNRGGPARGGFPWIRASFFVIVLGVVALPFTPQGKRLAQKIERSLKPVPVVQQVDEDDILRQAEARLREEYEQELADLRKAAEEARKQAAAAKESGEPEVLPRIDEHSATTGGDVTRLRSGIRFKTQVKVEKGELASKERVDDDSYVAEYTLSVKVPEPSRTLDQLEKVNPNLGKLLPGLDEMLGSAEVSRWFYQLYENKTERLKRDSTKLAELLTKHNFYDCETILNMSHPQTKRRVFLMQAEMDVVSDGSDGDRLATMPDSIVNSTHYQPFTSYGWKKQTKTPNPMVAGWEKRIGNANRELADPATTAERKAWLKERIKYLKRGIEDMTYRSYLIAEYDPFVVIPVNLLTASGDVFAPKVGDYAVVVHGKDLYPAIVGDGGPTFKVGEASLRMAKQINSKASPYSRPVSDLTVTYVVFPGSRDEKKGPPNYEKWRIKCGELINEIGGLGEGVELFEWEDLLPQKELPVEEAPEGGVIEGE